MDTAQTVAALHASLRAFAPANLRFRQNHQDVAFVPTMGALHEGHLALVRHARRLAPRVVASVFVNPTQFDRADDLAAYPRQAARDAELLRGASADLLFLPSAEVIYPPDYVRPPTPDLAGLDARFEGARRPGHFDGVVEVVRRLVALMRPRYMVMGRKDAQQLAVLRRAAALEAWPVEIVGVETVRAESGLALSSRNARLSPAGLAAAPHLHTALRRAAEGFVGGEDPASAAAAARGVLAKAGLEPEYVEVVRAADFLPVGEASAAGEDVTEALVIGAAWLEGVRLIDNVPVDNVAARLPLPPQTGRP